MMRPGSSVFRRAPAKVNLALSVGPPRPEDGMHPISSWMAPLDLADELEVTRLEPDRFSRYAILWHEEAPRPSDIDWSITKDLAVRAHLLLEEAVGEKLPVQLKLQKRIPVGGGLGGGSADAAAMLLAVRDLYMLDLSNDDLARLALRLGSDVAYCLGSGAAIVEGLGDQIERTPTPTGHLVLVLPRFGCPTGQVYRAYDDRPVELQAQTVQSMARAGVVEPGRLFNDLTPAAERVTPALAEIRGEVAAVAEAPVHMTGSGSTLFVWCEAGPDHALLLREALESELDDCVVVATRLVD